MNVTRRAVLMTSAAIAASAVTRQRAELHYPA
jgi:hypothetical protein